MTEEINSLLQRFVDDRDDLDDAELELLVSHLRDSEQLRAKLRDQLVINELICQNVAIDRRDFPAQVAQRLRDANHAEDLETQVLGMKSLADEEFDQWSDKQERRKRGFRRAVTAIALAAMTAAAGGFLAFQHYGPIGEFEQVRGDVSLVRDGRQVAVQPGMWVFDGDRLATGNVAHWSMRYSADSSRLSGRGAGALQLLGRRWEAKHIEIARGDVSADAQPQAKDHPMRFKVPVGEAVVVGTELHLLVDENETRLDVEHGRVELRKQVNGAEKQTVSTGEFATATQNGISSGRAAWPMQQFGLVLDNRFRQGEVAQVHLESQSLDAEFTPRGEATAQAKSLKLDGGAVQLAPFAADEILRRCQDANAFSIELWLKSGEGYQPDKAHLLSFGPDARSNLLVTSEGGALVLQMAYAPNDPASKRPRLRCPLPKNVWTHIVFTYGGSKLSCYVDGMHVQEWITHGDLSPWAPGYFVLGDSWDGDGSNAWAGEIGAVAVYDRALPVHEIFRNWRSLKAAGN